LLLLLSPRSTLFPYTTLFRSSQRMVAVVTLSDLSIELNDDVNGITKQLRDGEIPRSIVKAIQENNFQAERKIFSIAPKSSNSFTDRKSTRLNSSHLVISYAVF